MAALPLIGYISQSTQVDVEFLVDIVKYGDGYEQRAPRGIKSSFQSWSVQCEGLTLSTFQSLIASLETAAGVTSFTWTPPGAAASKLFVVESYSATAMSGDVYSITAKLRETTS